MKSIRLNKDTRKEEVKNDILDLHKEVMSWFLGKHKKEMDKFIALDKTYPRLIAHSKSFWYRDHNRNTYSIYFHTGTTSRHSEGNPDPICYPRIWDGYVIDLSNKDSAIPKRIQDVIDAIKGTKKSARLVHKAISDYDTGYYKRNQDIRWL